MKKREFIQTASIAFMPELQWDIDKTLKYAEKLWAILEQKGYGEPKEAVTREIKKAYDRLGAFERAQFDLFWTAFDYKHGKDKAAAVWLQMGAVKKDELKIILAAAKAAAFERKNLPEGIVAKMAQGWLSERRWLDKAVSETEQAEQTNNQHRELLRKISGDLAHAKRMAADTEDPFWSTEVEKLTAKLKHERDKASATALPLQPN